MNAEILAYFITWTCYGTFLPGDGRGWTKWHKGDQVPQPLLEDWCRDRLSESAVTLDEDQRSIVSAVVREHCELRGWTLHAVNCRSNHCHVVVTALRFNGKQVRDELKSWATRRLKSHQRETGLLGATIRGHWWTRNGSVRVLFDADSVDAAVTYTRDAQDVGGSRAN